MANPTGAEAAPKCFIYTRISRDGEGAGLGIGRQEEDCRKLADRLGYDVVEVISDNSISAHSGAKRPGYESMLRRLDEVQAVLVYHTDRLHRRALDLEAYIQAVEKHGTKTHGVVSGEMDLNTATGQQVARMLGAIAQGESGRMGERLTRQKQAAKLDGKWNGGPKPFGWQRVERYFKIDDSEAELIRSAYDRILEGGSLNSVLHSWNDSDVKPLRAKQWSYATVSAILCHPRNAGLTDFDGEIRQGSPFPPIVSEDEWRAVKGIIKNPSRRTSFSNKNRWLLSNIALCQCGRPVVVGSVGSNGRVSYTAYRCSARDGGEHVSKKAELVDEYVASAVIGALNSEEFREALAESEAASPQAKQDGIRAQALRQELDEVTQSYMAKRITLGQMEMVTADVRQKLEELEARMSSRTGPGLPSGIASGDVRGFWESAGLEVRRSLVREMFTVTLLRSTPGVRGFHTDTVHLSPKVWPSRHFLGPQADKVKRMMDSAE